MDNVPAQLKILYLGIYGYCSEGFLDTVCRYLWVLYSVTMQCTVIYGYYLCPGIYGYFTQVLTGTYAETYGYCTQKLMDTISRSLRILTQGCDSRQQDSEATLPVGQQWCGDNAAFRIMSLQGEDRVAEGGESCVPTRCWLIRRKMEITHKLGIYCSSLRKGDLVFLHVGVA